MRTPMQTLLLRLGSSTRFPFMQMSLKSLFQLAELLSKKEIVQFEPVVLDVSVTKPVQGTSTGCWDVVPRLALSENLRGRFCGQRMSFTGSTVESLTASQAS